MLILRDFPRVFGPIISLCKVTTIVLNCFVCNFPPFFILSSDIKESTCVYWPSLDPRKIGNISYKWISIFFWNKYGYSYYCVWNI